MDEVDVAVVGAGAAGLATAIFAKRMNPRASVVAFDGASRPGAKILVSGGGRCNVTNTVVSEHDFWGGSRAVIRRVLRGLPVEDTIDFFRGIGVALHEEPDGKLFPNTNRARDVLDALLTALARAGGVLRSGCRVTDVQAGPGGFRVAVADRVVAARRVVLATGGESLPKTGSDGAGLAIAERLGHAIVRTTPALVPLLLDGKDGGIHAQLTGVAQPADLSVWLGDRLHLRLAGSLLWTHFGISGPVALNASRHWLRAQLEGPPCRLTVNFCPGDDFEAIDARLTAAGAERPKASVHAVLAGMLPASVASTLLQHLAIVPATELAHFTREHRRRLAHALAAWPLAVIGSRGYNYAEATAGGVSLADIDASTLESRRCPGLFFVGEMLDVDGRIGGFNFQWAWSSAYVAARALSRAPGLESGSRLR